MSKFNSIQDPENGKLYGIDTRRGKSILSRYLGKMVGDLPIPDQSRWNKYGERPIEKYDFIADKEAMTDYQQICCKDDWIEDKHDQQWFPRDIGNIDKPRTIRKYADKIEEFYMTGWGDKFGERRLETTNKYRKGIFKEVAKKWGSARYTGTISRNGQITLNIYSKSIKGGFGQDLATYRLNPIGNNEYEVIFGIVGEGVSFISTAIKSSSDTNFNFPA